MQAKHRIAVIPGDGIGVEVMPEGLRVLLEELIDFACELGPLAVVRVNFEPVLGRLLLAQAKDGA